MRFRLRPATAADARLLYDWRNDAEVRRQSFTADELAWDAHLAWLERKLASDAARLWVLEADGRPAGQIRYERRGDEAEISLSVAREWRGRGLGTGMLRLSLELGCRELGVSRVFGLVKENNAASCRAFVAAGFQPGPRLDVGGAVSIRFERRCPHAEGGRE